MVVIKFMSVILAAALQFSTSYVNIGRPVFRVVRRHIAVSIDNRQSLKRSILRELQESVLVASIPLGKKDRAETRWPPNRVVRASWGRPYVYLQDFIIDCWKTDSGPPRRVCVYRLFNIITMRSHHEQI
jgi:hypothetical protein